MLFVNQSTGKLTKDILEAFVESGFDVTLFTGNRKGLKRSLNPKVNLKKTFGYNRKSIISRLFSGLGYSLVYILFFIVNRPKEVVVFTNPYYNLFLTSLLCKLKRIDYHIIVYDLYPEVLVQTGMLKKKHFVFKILKSNNRFVFNSAKSIITLSDSMKRAIEVYSSSPEKVHVVHNWLINQNIIPIKREHNSFATEQGIQDKTVVLYSGNMGLTHDLESLIEAANELQGIKKLMFLFVGEGAKKKRLINLVKNYQLQNVKFLPYQDVEKFPEVIASADIGVVSLGSGGEGISVPSKTYSNLAAGLALLCIAPKKSELKRLIDTYDCGLLCEPLKVDVLVRELRLLLEDNKRLEQYKKNSYIASHDFTPKNAYRYVEIIKNL